MEKTDTKAEDDCDTVTETTIVGVTESGVIRKRSVKRRIVRDDNNGKTPDRKYGHDAEQYSKLTERVLAERATVHALELLQERWRMITFMYDDCLELVKQWDERRLMKKHMKRKKRLLFLSFVSLPFGVSLVTWLLARWWW